MKVYDDIYGEIDSETLHKIRIEDKKRIKRLRLKIKLILKGSVV